MKMRTNIKGYTHTHTINSGFRATISILNELGHNNKHYFFIAIINPSTAHIEADDSPRLHSLSLPQRHVLEAVPWQLSHL